AVVVGEPAKAWATSSQAAAVGPVTVMAVRLRWRRRGRTRARASAGPGTRSTASSGPQTQVGPAGADAPTPVGAPGSVAWWTAKENGRALTPMWMTWRSRGVAASGTPSASWTSAPWAQVSIRRAVVKLATLIGGPNQDTRALGLPAWAAAMASRV